MAEVLARGALGAESVDPMEKLAGVDCPVGVPKLCVALKLNPLLDWLPPDGAPKSNPCVAEPFVLDWLAPKLNIEPVCCLGVESTPIWPNALPVCLAGVVCP